MIENTNNELQKKARTDLLATLQKQKIKSLRLLYRGGADEGNIETIERYPGTWGGSYSNTIQEYRPLENENIEDLVRDLIWDILDDNFGSWYNEEGGHGTIYWDMKNDTIKICHNVMFMESIYEEKEGL